MSITTKKYSIKDSKLIKSKTHFPEQLIEMIAVTAKNYEINPDNAIFCRKGYEQSKTPDFSEQEKTAVSYITTSRKDRDNEIVYPDGIILEEYRKHPVVLAFHRYDELPIGKNLWIKQDNPLTGLIAKTQYANHEEAIKLFEYRKGGFPLATSIGFLPIEYILNGEKGFEKELAYMLSKGWVKDINEVKNASAIIKKSVLLEYSDVSVPANPDAIQLAVSKGIKTFVSFDNLESPIENYEENIEIEKSEEEDEISFTETIVEMKPAPEETEESIRIRVKDPKGFQENSFKTVKIKKDKPTISAVMGKLKDEKTMTIQSLIFPKSEGWTKKEAVKWVKEHKDSLKDFKDEEIKEKEVENNPNLYTPPDILVKDLDKKEKTVGISEEISMRTILDAIYRDLSNHSDNYPYITDIFPSKNISGYIIVEEIKNSKPIYKSYDYEYNKKEGKATLSNEKECYPKYVLKGFKDRMDVTFESLGKIREAKILFDEVFDGNILISDALEVKKINVGIDIFKVQKDFKEKKNKVKDSFKNFVSLSSKGMDEWTDLFIKFEEKVFNFGIGEDLIKEFCKEHDLLYKGIDNIDEKLKEKDNFFIEIHSEKDFDESSIVTKTVKTEGEKVIELKIGKLKNSGEKCVIQAAFDNKNGWDQKSATTWIANNDVNKFAQEGDLSALDVVKLTRTLLDDNNKQVLESVERMLKKAMGRVEI